LFHFKVYKQKTTLAERML